MLVGCASENRPFADVTDATDGAIDRGAATINDGATDAGRSDAASCADGRTSCADACVDLMTDGANCGACGRACDAGQACGRGACASPDPASQRSCEPTPVVGCGRLLVVGGTFPMGHEGAPFGVPVQPGVSVSDYYLDTYEVTVARFRRFWESGHPAPGPVVHYPDGVELPYRGPVRNPGRTTGWTETPGPHEDYPMNSMEWATAQAFCVWDGGRLPTEAELEFAAGTRASLSYPWGEEAPDSQLCWSTPTRRMAPCSVGAYPASRGFYDLVGGVWEWAADEFSVYGVNCWSDAFRRRNPLCILNRTSDDDRRTIRGGSWTDVRATEVHGSSRMAQYHWSDAVNIGFRCASSPR